MKRRAVWIFAVAALLLAGTGLRRLRFDTDVLGLLPADLPVVQGLKWHQTHFASAHELIITVSAPDAPDAEAAARRIAGTLSADPATVRRVLWRPPWLDDPASVGEFIAWTWLQQPPEATARLAARLEPGRVAASLAEAREQLATSISGFDLARFSYDPLGLTTLPGSGGGLGNLAQAQGLFASADGTFRLLFVEPPSRPANYKAEIAWLAKVRQRVEEMRRARDIPATVRIGFTGGPVFAAEAAGGMERDMTGSAPVTLLIIAALFWLAHRRLRPLLAIVIALVITVVGTLALGGLLFGTLNVVSLGFAAILLGLVVDYGLMTYQKFVAAPGQTVGRLQRDIGPGIFWSALTTAGAFLMLNLGGLPGLAQLGSLVALGVMLGVAVMLFGFLPLAVKEGGAGFQPARVDDAAKSAQKPEATPKDRLEARPALAVRLSSFLPFGWAVTLLLLMASGGLVWRGLPRIDRSPEALRPRDSTAYAILDELKVRMERGEEPLWLITSGSSEQDVSDKLRAVERSLTTLRERGEISSFAVASGWWPNPGVQQTNLAILKPVIDHWPDVRAAVIGAGFTSNSLALGNGIAREWQTRSGRDLRDWPTGALGGWIMRQAAAHDAGRWFAFGLVQPSTNAPATVAPAWAASLEGTVVSGWMMLGGSVLQRVQARLPWVLLGLVIVLTACFRGAFGRWQEMLLSFAALVAGLLGLLAVMRLMGWSWNMLNLMALPLLLGAGAYYTIHVQLALRRYGDDLSAMWRSTGRALLLCAGTTVTGFSSLAWSGNAGLASLGQISAAGIAMIFLVSMIALPAWWRLLSHPSRINLSAGGCLAAEASQANPRPDSGHPLPPDGRGQGGGPSEPRPKTLGKFQPSSFYRVTAWRFGLVCARILPLKPCQSLCRIGTWAYRRLHPERVRIVTENLRPVVGDSAEATAARLFDQFALKLCDLWRYEAGRPVQRQFRALAGWENFEAALQTGRGILLVTIHLGNWEFGAPLLARRGIHLLVLTAPEPGTGFTELRQRARARWGVETFVVGDDPFAFVEIIRRLQDGGCVALLVDRPPAAGAVEVELFGRPFRASVAAAELARATGCAIVPVVLPRVDGVYSAEVLPPVAYDRAGLGDRAARIQLTGEILRAFEPSLRQHPEQWFHFVPVWPTDQNRTPTTDGHG